jgi:hypothetical protein
VEKLCTDLHQSHRATRRSPQNTHRPFQRQKEKEEKQRRSRCINISRISPSTTRDRQAHSHWHQQRNAPSRGPSCTQCASNCTSISQIKPRARRRDRPAKKRRRGDKPDRRRRRGSKTHQHGSDNPPQTLHLNRPRPSPHSGSLVHSQSRLLHTHKSTPNTTRVPRHVHRGPPFLNTTHPSRRRTRHLVCCTGCQSA